ncbi:hypothetical protein U2G59_001413 [Vibrio alginolyticus]|nr:hypothetical protein [Vibrio alginolyticus]
MDFLLDNISTLIALGSLAIATISLVISVSKGSFDKKVIISQKSADLSLLLFELMSSQRKLDLKLSEIESQLGNINELDLLKMKSNYIKIENESQLCSGESSEMLVVDERLRAVKQIAHVVSQLHEEADKLLASERSR